MPVNNNGSPAAGLSTLFGRVLGRPTATPVNATTATTTATATTTTTAPDGMTRNTTVVAPGAGATRLSRAEVIERAKKAGVPQREQIGPTCGLYALGMVMDFWNEKNAKNATALVQD